MQTMLKVNCARCNKEFERTLALVNYNLKRGTKNYCSHECSNLSHIKIKAQKLKTEPKITTLSCIHCHGDYTLPNWMLKIKKNQCCSRRCWVESEREKRKVTLQCPICKNDFIRSPYQRNI